MKLPKDLSPVPRSGANGIDSYFYARKIPGAYQASYLYNLPINDENEEDESLHDDDITLEPRSVFNIRNDEALDLVKYKGSGANKGRAKWRLQKMAVHATLEPLSPANK